MLANDAWRELQAVVGMQGVFLHVQPDRQGASAAEHDGGEANLAGLGRIQILGHEARREIIAEK